MLRLSVPERHLSGYYLGLHQMAHYDYCTAGKLHYYLKSQGSAPRRYNPQRQRQGANTNKKGATPPVAPLMNN